MKYLINLFPKPKQNSSEKIIYFATHYLRYVLVITQFVAICVFFYRFKVDQEIVDLRDKLHQQESILTSTGGLIGRIQELDNKMRNVKTIMQDQDAFRSEYAYFFSILPTDIIISKMDISAKEVAINGISTSVNPIRSLNDKLIADGKYKTVNLLNIEKGEAGFSFNMQLSQYSTN
ncbi:MAG: hypothetical protein O3B87_00085 [bacterium]|nr:hypothetical protein [bacterium]